MIHQSSDPTVYSSTSTSSISTLTPSGVNKSQRSRREGQLFLISIEEVLFNVRGAPFDRESLRNWLKSSVSEENLDFWLAIQEYREHVFQAKDTIRIDGVKTVVQAFPKTMKDIESGINEEDDDDLKRNPLMWARSIISKYVGVNANIIQVNLSDDMTRQLQQAVDNGQIPDFYEAQTEAKMMIQGGDRFGSFIQEMLTTNIDKREAKCRFLFGFVFFLVSWGLGMILRYAVGDVIIPQYATGLIVFLPFFIGFDSLVISYTRTCYRNAFHGIASSLRSDSKFKTNECKLQDQTAKSCHRSRAIFVFAAVILSSIGFSVIVAVLPSV